MTFKYKVATQTGEILEGVYEADNKEEALSVLKRQQYYIISLEKVRRIELDTLLSPKVKAIDISMFSRQFCSMLRAGVNLVACLEILRTQLPNKTLQKSVVELYSDIQKGITLSTAMKRHDKVFPPLIISMIEAGEVSGNLDTMLDRAATFYEKESSLQQKIKGAMVYPIILMLVTVAVVIFLITNVMPTFVDMFEGGKVSLPWPTRFLLGVSNGLKSNWYIYTALLLVCIVALKMWGDTDKGRLSIDGLKLRIPLFGSVTLQVITARFTRTLSTLLASGIPLVQAFDSVNRVIGNEVISRKLDIARDEVVEGTALSRTIKTTEVFPPMLESMIRVGEESGTLNEALERTAIFYEEEVDYAVEKMTTVFEPLLIVFMAVIIGFIVIAMLLPMFDMISMVG